MYIEYLPFWDGISALERDQIEKSSEIIHVPAGPLSLSKLSKKYYILAVTEGRVRVYMLAEDGKEITFYRISQGSFCTFPLEKDWNGCPQYEVLFQAELSTVLLCIPVQLHYKLMDTSVAYVKSQLYVERKCCARIFGIVNEMLSKHLESRVAGLLLEESRLCKTDKLKITHEMIARHLGSVREVITRVLKVLQKQNVLLLHRGVIQLTDIKKLQELL